MLYTLQRAVHATKVVVGNHNCHIFFIHTCLVGILVVMVVIEDGVGLLNHCLSLVEVVELERKFKLLT